MGGNDDGVGCEENDGDIDKDKKKDIFSCLS